MECPCLYWIKNELGLPDLADKLMQLRRKNRNRSYRSAYSNSYI